MFDDAALLDLLARLRQRGYRFHTVTPATHARVLARPLDRPAGLRDVFGWNRPFAEADLEPELFALLRAAGLLERSGRDWKSALRVSSLDGDLFLHSSYPTDQPDSVFFGPDTYRFVRFVQQRWPATPAPRVADMGAGCGAGGIAAARLAPHASVTLVDVNPRALALARVNARAAGVDVELVEAGTLPGPCDVVIANPPYIIDAGKRAYRDGGELFGGAIPLEWVNDALARLAPGGTLLLYTGAAVVDGTAPLLEAIELACRDAGATLEIDEIDPDVFGEELEQPQYAPVERIAAIGAVVRTSG